MKLFLFDVDETLIKSDLIEFEYWNAVVNKYFDFKINKSSIYMHGKTDRRILFEIFQLAGVKKPEKDKRFLKAINDIDKIFFEVMKNKKIETIPDVEKFIKLLMKKDVIIGLLTGNAYKKAKSKLISCGLWKYFEIGAFGDTTKKRSELVSVALKKAKNKFGLNFDKKDVYLVGETVRDIRCAKEAGVNIIAVATGKETMKQLKQEKPNYLFKNFSNSDKIIASVF